MKNILSIVIRIFLTAAMLFFLFKWINLEEIGKVLHLIRLNYLIVAGALFISIYFLCFIRWYWLLKSIDIRVPWRKLIISSFGGVFFNLFLPSTIGGDFVRIMDLTNHLKRTKEIAASVFVDRLSGFAALAFTALLAMLYGYSHIDKSGIFIPIIILFTSLSVTIIILFTKNIFSRLKNLIPGKKIRIKIENLHTEILYFRTKPKALLTSLLISFATQIIGIVSNYYIFLALGINVKLIYLFIFVPLIGAVAMIPVSIGGLGIRDMGSAFFFAKIGITKDVAVASSLLNFFFIAVISSFCGLIYVFALYNRWLQRR